MPVWPEMSVTLARDNSRQEVLSVVLLSETVQSLNLSRGLNSVTASDFADVPVSGPGTWIILSVPGFFCC